MLYAGSNDEVVRFLLLHDQPHALDIILSVAPVTQRIHVAQLQMILQALGNAAGSQRDLAGHEVLTAALRLMVEQNAVDSEHAISIAVLLDHPEAILLCNCIRRIGMERSGLTLGNFLHLAVQLRGRSLIHLAGLGQAADTDSLQHTQNAQCIHIAGVFGCIEGDLNMALCSQIVDLIGLDLAYQTDEAGGIRQVAVMQMDSIFLDQVVDAGGVGDGSAADNAVDFIPLLQQELCQIGAVLTRDAGDQCFFHVFYSSLKKRFIF